MNQQAAKKKRFNARFPPARIKKIMQLDEEVGKVAAAVPVLISRALENFVESFLKKTAEVTTTRQSRTLTPLHVKQCIQADRRFAFLKEIVANVSDIQSEEEGPSQPSTPVTPQIPIANPFQLIRGSSIDVSNVPKAKGTRRPLAVKSKSLPTPRRGLKSNTDSDEGDLTPEFESDEEDDDTDSSQGSRKRPKLSQSVSLDTTQRPPHPSPAYCSVIRGPVLPLTHPYSFLGTPEPSLAFLKEPQPAHIQPRVPPLPLLNLKAPLPAHLNATQNLPNFSERSAFPQSAVKVDIDGVQPFQIEVALPGQNNGLKLNGTSGAAIRKTADDMDDDYDA